MAIDTLRLPSHSARTLSRLDILCVLISTVRPSRDRGFVALGSPALILGMRRNPRPRQSTQQCITGAALEDNEYDSSRRMNSTCKRAMQPIMLDKDQLHNVCTPHGPSFTREAGVSPSSSPSTTPRLRWDKFRESFACQPLQQHL